MAIKVVSQPENETFKHRCQSCWAVLEFNHNDIMIHDMSDEWHYYPEYKGYLICPNCGERICIGKIDIYRNGDKEIYKIRK